MKYFKSFSLFENQDWSLEEIIRMMDAGLMTSAEAVPAMRTIIRKLLAEAGTSEIWSAEGIEALREIPAVAAVNEPEAQPFWDAGFKPVSSIVQLAQGTLAWQRSNQDSGFVAEELIFYERTGYVRQMLGGRLQVMARANPGGGLSFFKAKMQELNERWALEIPLVPSRSGVAAQQRRTDALSQIEATLVELFEPAVVEPFIAEYIRCLRLGFSLGELAKLPQKIEKTWPNLPIRFVNNFGTEQWQLLIDQVPASTKLFLATSPILYQRFNWHTEWYAIWQAAADAGKVNQQVSKPVRWAS
jgi:hypothetical protein